MKITCRCRRGSTRWDVPWGSRCCPRRFWPRARPCPPYRQPHWSRHRPPLCRGELPAYRIQIGDVLDVRLLLNPELNEEVTVRPDGHISTTVAQDAVAVGKTPMELATYLRSQYGRELTNPKLSVEVKSFAPTRVYVGGEVNNAGEFVTVGPTLTLSQAISRAGGTKLSSDDTSVFIIRRGPGDKPEFLSVKWKAVPPGPGSERRLFVWRV